MDQKIPNCASFNLRKASRGIAQFYDQWLLPSGLKTTQFTLLASLSQMGPTPINELATALGMDRTTLTRNVRLLEQNQLIKGESGQDARTRLLSLTSKGRNTLKKALPHWAQAQAKFLELFGEQRWERLLHELIEVSQVAKKAKLK